MIRQKIILKSVLLLTFLVGLGWFAYTYPLFITGEIYIVSLILFVLSFYLFIRSWRQSRPFPKKIIVLLMLAIILFLLPSLLTVKGIEEYYEKPSPVILITVQDDGN